MKVEHLNDMSEYMSLLKFPGYLIHQDGVIWSCRVGGKRWPYCSKEWKKLKSSYGNRKTKHLFIRMVNKYGKSCYVLIHRLVLEAFVGPCPVGMECRHLDGNPENNRLENLKWGTHKENVADSKRHGTLQQGSRHCNAKITEKDAISIRLLYASGRYSQRDLAKWFGLSQTAIKDITTRKNWKSV